jgi:hypothetical protein
MYFSFIRWGVSRVEVAETHLFVVLNFHARIVVRGVVRVEVKKVGITLLRQSSANRDPDSSVHFVFRARPHFGNRRGARRLFTLQTDFARLASTVEAGSIVNPR